ncbi:MAG TPA: DUF2306 domain-containing protein [Burkholderiaceae bacterium]|nr:DUF2306 domain-containing protein [Burkholderiaceae bacterium]
MNDQIQVNGHSATQKSNWRLPFVLIALSIVPLLAGSVRLFQIGSGAPVTMENARFISAPMPVVLHIISAAIYSILGAFQFSASFRRNNPSWHRTSGRLLIPLGLVTAFSGLWMTLFYTQPLIADASVVASFDGSYLQAIRFAVSVAMISFIYLGLMAIRKRNIPHHRAWMMRSYALALGAGTQVFTHIPWFIFPSIHSELARTLCMGAGWAINIAVAEWFISENRN